MQFHGTGRKAGTERKEVMITWKNGGRMELEEG
jgi:hypothetical protein